MQSSSCTSAHSRQNAEPWDAMTTKTDSETGDTEGTLSRPAIFLLILLGCVCAISGLLMTMPNAFMFHELERRKASTSEIQGMFSLYALAVLVISPIIGMVSTTTKRRQKLLKTFLPLWGCSSLAFALLITPFKLGLSLRFIQGVFGASTITATYGLISDWFREDRDQAMSIVQAMTGFFYIVGPVIGGFLYEIGGFALPFIFVAILALIEFALIVFVSPKLVEKALLNSDDSGSERLNATSDEENGSDSWSQSDLRSCSHLSSCANSICDRSKEAWWRSISLGFLAIALIPFVLTVGLGLAHPLLASHLEQEFHVNAGSASLMYAIYGVAFTVTSALVCKITKTYGRRRTSGVGILMAGVGFVMMGPCRPIEKIIGDKEWLRWIVLVTSRMLSGVGAAAAFVPSLPMLLNRAENDGFRSADKSSVIGHCSGIWAAMQALGNMIGPALGTWMQTLCDFDTVTDASAGLYLVFGMFLMVFVSSGSVDYDDTDVETNLVQSRRNSASVQDQTQKRTRFADISRASLERKS